MNVIFFLLSISGVYLGGNLNGKARSSTLCLLVTDNVLLDSNDNETTAGRVIQGYSYISANTEKMQPPRRIFLLRGVLADAKCCTHILQIGHPIKT